MFFTAVPVCLSACPADFSESYECILMRFFGQVGTDPRNNRLDTGGNPDQQQHHHHHHDTRSRNLFTIPIPILNTARIKQENHGENLNSLTDF